LNCTSSRQRISEVQFRRTMPLLQAGEQSSVVGRQSSGKHQIYLMAGNGPLTAGGPVWAED
jgi:hypothetical protein